MIPPSEDSNFVADMENVLRVYKRPYNSDYPVVCMDESPKQLIRETRKSIPPVPGRLERYDYEYGRGGACNIFMANEPLAGNRLVKVTERKTKTDWAQFVKEIADLYPDAKRITLVMDNFATHKAGSFYEAFAPKEARGILDRLEFIFTPKHGSWLNMAEIELSALNGQCLDRRIPDLETMNSHIAAWENDRNNRQSKINWHFFTTNARIKLKRLYPNL